MARILIVDDSADMLSLPSETFPAWNPQFLGQLQHGNSFLQMAI